MFPETEIKVTNPVTPSVPMNFETERVFVEIPTEYEPSTKEEVVVRPDILTISLCLNWWIAVPMPRKVPSPLIG